VVDYWEVYDRKEDPLELKNCLENPHYAKTVVDLRRELDRLRKEPRVPEQEPRSVYGRARF
jgi:hypothetical protein